MEYKKETVTVMMTAFGIWNVEQEIAKTKILCRIFQLVPTAAMILFQVRRNKNLMCHENVIIVGKSLSKDFTWLSYVKKKLNIWAN